MHAPPAPVPPPVANSDSARPPRLLALDVFRGLTIAGMILVNNPGSWEHVYAPLRHAPWHGWTPTDLIFPFFVFIVGVAIVPALSRRRQQAGGAGALVPHILRRAALLFLFGLLLHGFPYLTAGLELHPRLVALRIPGVLQRIALCYAAAALLWLVLPRQLLAVAIAVLLLGYHALLRQMPIDAETTNVVAWLDTRLLPGHLYRPGFDPEGVLSTLPAIASCLFGVLVGELFQGAPEAQRRSARLTVRLLVLGGAWLLLGLMWSRWLPINKPLWTSSYAVFTAGLATGTLALCHGLCDVRGYTRGTLPLVVYGRNALLVFLGSGFLARTLALITVAGADTRPVNLQQALYRGALASWLPPQLASLAYALLWVAGWYVVLYALYRRGISLRV